MRGCFVPLCGVVVVAVLVAGGPSLPVVPQEIEGTPILVEFDEIKDGQLINVKNEMIVVPPGDELIMDFDSDEMENEVDIEIKQEDDAKDIDEGEETYSEASTELYPLDIDLSSEDAPEPASTESYPLDIDLSSVDAPEPDSTESYPLDIDLSSVHAPEPIHDEGDIYINKDNIVPILKTLALAYTRKESPTYKDILKAGSLSGFKTAFKYLGKPSMGSTLLKAIRSYTHYLDDDEAEDEETEVLSDLAEKYLATHKFKVMFPESLLLHEEDMLEFVMKREAQEVMTGRSISSQREMLIEMPRTDPAVHTVLSIGPLTWLAVLGGLFSIPYFFSGESSSTIAERDDHIQRLAPSVWLQPPPAYFGSGEEEYHPHQAVDDTEYQQYLRDYDAWYRQWYHLYEQYNQNQTPQIQQQARPGAHQPRPGAQQPRPVAQQPRPVAKQPVQQPRPVAKQPVQQPRPVAKQPLQQPPPAVQKVPRHPQVKQQRHQKPQQQQVAAARPVVQAVATPAPKLIAPQDASRSSSIINVPESNAIDNNFGTFQSSTRDGDSHFKVLQDISGEPPSTAKPAATTSTSPKTPATVTLTQSRPIQRPNPSPQPVFRHNTTPKTETGFVPIIKPTQKPEDSSKSGFSEIKSSDVIQKSSNTTKKATSSSNTKIKATSDKPELKPSAQITSSTKSQKQDTETTTLRLSPITSGVFKTTRAPTPKPATTPPPGSRHAIFVKSSTDKTVRVVTSSSFVLPDGTKHASIKDGSLPDLQRPQRLVQSKDAPVSQQLDNSLREPTIVNAVPVSQPLIQARPPPTVVKSQAVARPQSRPPLKTQPVARPQSRPPLKPQPQPAHVSRPQSRPPPLPSHGGGFVRTNVPTHIQVIDHAIESTTAVPTTTTTITPTTTMPIYALDPFYGPRLSRVDVIFHQLGLESEGCREQVVCNIYKNPDVYTPFSDYLSRQLTVKLEELQKPKVSDERILRFFRYLKAAREGQDGNECLSRYPSCPTDTTRLSHKPTFSAFHKVELLMNAGQ